jgi:hypothetical protein
MSKTLLGGNSVVVSYNDTTGARYFSFCTAIRTGTPSTIETAFAQKMVAAGTLSLMTLNVLTNAYTSTCNIKSRVNSADGAQVIAVGAGATGVFQDATHSDSLAAGDKINGTLTVPQFFANFTLGPIGVAFDGTSSVASLWHAKDAQGTTSFNAGTASVTRYLSLCGSGDNANGWFVTSETDAKTLVRAAGSFSILAAYIATNSSTNAMSVTFRVNGVDGNQALSIGASSTGYIEDTTHSDSVASGDDVNLKTVSGAGTVNAAVQFFGAGFTSSGTNWDMRAASTRLAASSWSAGSTNYHSLQGGIAPTTTEASAQIKVPFASYFDRLAIRVAAAAGTSTVTMTLRVNGADGQGSVSITGSTTGTFEDTTHVDTIAANDLVNYKIPALGSNSFAPRFIGVRGDTANPGGAPSGRRRRVFALF